MSDKIKELERLLALAHAEAAEEANRLNHHVVFVDGGNRTHQGLKESCSICHPEVASLKTVNDRLTFLETRLDDLISQLQNDKVV